MVRRRHFIGLLTGLLVGSLGVGKATTASADAQVDLNLVLAVDASGSVSAHRFDLQKRGYSAAFRDAQVIKAIRSGEHRSIAVTVLQWTGYTLQAIAVPWTLVRDDASARALADAIDATPRILFAGGTSISGAIDYSARLFAQCPYTGTRRVIDISGDGSNNNGRPARLARDDAVRAGIGINGLPILTIEPTLDQYYASDVIGGPNAFLIPATSYETFAEAIRRKLILEIADAGRPDRVEAPRAR
jgi:hypothetical protein